MNDRPRRRFSALLTWPPPCILPGSFSRTHSGQSSCHSDKGLHFLWQGALLAGVWCVLRSLLRNHRANTRYSAGCLILLLMAAAPLATFYLSGQSDTQLTGVVAPSPAPATTALLGTPPARTSSGSITSPRIIEGFSAHIEELLPWLVGLWIAGVLCLSLRLGKGLWSVNAMQRHYAVPASADWIIDEAREGEAEIAEKYRPYIVAKRDLEAVQQIRGWGDD